MYALRTASVRFGPVRCGVSDENTSALPAAAPAPTARAWAARRSTRSRAARRRCARACPARCTPGATHGQPLSIGGVGERDPAREVLLRLDERVAVVLVPREPARLLGLLVDGLVPVHVHVGADEVGAEVDEHGAGRERRAAIGERATRCVVNVIASASAMNTRLVGLRAEEAPRARPRTRRSRR